MIHFTESYSVRYYGVFFALGYVLSYYVLMYIFNKENLPISTLEKMTLAALIGGVLGSRLGHCFFYEPSVYLQNPLKILFIWEGGLSSHGGSFGILIGFWVVLKKVELNYLQILSRSMLVVPLAAVFIRLGNLMNSEIYGIPTDLPWGFVFAKSSAVLNGMEDAVPRHPTQLYEALAYLTTFIALQVYAIKTLNKGKKLSDFFIIGIFFIGIFFSRFLIEFVKTPQVSFENNMTLDMGQWLSIPFIIAGIVSLVAYKKAESSVGSM